MTPAFARKPAVDPVIGVSIEEYKEVPPEQAKGFNFERKPNSNKAQANPERIHSPEKLAVDSATDESSSSGKLLILFLIFLPIVASGITFYKLGRRQRDIHGLEDVETIKSEEETKAHDDHEDHDDYDWPKAS